MKRVAVIGCPGSGKSTLSIRLAEKTGLPLIHLDDIYHKDSWSTPARKPKWRALQRELVAGPEWIIDGNYKSTQAIRIEAADTVVFLDYPRWLCITRVLLRRLWQFLGRSAAGGNPERLGWDFLEFVWNYRRVDRPAVLMLLQGKEGVYILDTPEATELFLQSLQ